tara:strand:- start:3880 stop:4923 length:1044 start_codon:yes stop_codon:yes gene_type:complete
MIVSEIYNGSGLGNQLWNIVAPRCIAEHRGFRWGVRRDVTNSGGGASNTQTVGLKTFKGCNFLTNIDWGDEVTGGETPVEGQEPSVLPDGIEFYGRERVDEYPYGFHALQNEDSMIYDELLYETVPDNTKIDGTFQRLRYINDRRSDIIEWLKPNITVTDYSSDDFCVIQFRGGEYLITSAWCPPEYYRMAADRMLEINPNMKFGVITDDPENAKKYIPWAPIIGASSTDEIDPLAHLQGSGFYVYKGGPIGIDYSILNNAVNSILTSSTFAFWPAWTNTKAKNIIAPKYWNDYKRSTGYWRGDDNIVDDWKYIDNSGRMMNGVDCKEEYKEYRKQHEFYNDKPDVV